MGGEGGALWEQGLLGWEISGRTVVVLASLLLCSFSLSLSVCLHRLSAGRGEDAWASFPRLVSMVGLLCSLLECPGGVHAVSLAGLESLFSLIPQIALSK